MRRLCSAVLVLLLLASCSSEPKGKLTVFAATSLTGAFREIGKAFEDDADTKVTFNFGASSALAQQITEGEAPDVFASADVTNMTKLIGAKTVEVPTLFTRNRLVIVTQPKNPTRIRTLADLGGADTVSLCAAEVPCGTYAARALSQAGVTLDESHVTRAPTAAATLSAVADGDATAAIVYVTDAKAAGKRVRAVAIPDEQNVVANYPIAALTNATNGKEARAFVKFVQGRKARAILQRYGFVTG